MTKASDFRNQNDEELQTKCVELRKEIFDLRNAIASKKEDVKANQVQLKRKDIARCLTILRERQLAANM